jgi:HD-GYP domain-containing protein (c-di-GMP phosphodiesterase class II)
MRLIQEGSGKEWDPRLVKIFLSFLKAERQQAEKAEREAGKNGDSPSDTSQSNGRVTSENSAVVAEVGAED